MDRECQYCQKYCSVKKAFFKNIFIKTKLAAQNISEIPVINSGRH